MKENGSPQKETETKWLLTRQTRNGCVLRRSPEDKGLWFESTDAAIRWAAGMGITDIKRQGVSND